MFKIRLYQVLINLVKRIYGNKGLLIRLIAPIPALAFLQIIVGIVIRFIEVDFTFGHQNYVRYIDYLLPIMPAWHIGQQRGLR